VDHGSPLDEQAGRCGADARRQYPLQHLHNDRTLAGNAWNFL
jgi:hypothetical protein